MTDKAVRVMKRMSLAKASIVVFVAVALLTTAFMVKMSQGEALPADPLDATVVPHYFGPWPNWVLSPTTQPNATVTITGTGTGATATATVDRNGTVTGISVTNPGSGYTSATVVITPLSGGATATAVLTNSGAVTAVTVTAAGSGYKQPTVVISGGGATTAATATAYGGVDAVTVANAGTGYTFPTVDFDMPDDPNGTQAVGAATMDANGGITGIDVTNPGSGYATAPGVWIRDGTVMDPIVNAGAGASATATLKILSVSLDTFGAGYTFPPNVTISDALGTPTTLAIAEAAVDSGLVSAITVNLPGSGYLTGAGIKKFYDPLPGLYVPNGPASAPAPGTKYIPLGVPVPTRYPAGTGVNADQYDIAVVQYRTNFSSSMPEGTLVRGYVQLETPEFLAANPGKSLHYALQNELVNGDKVNIMKSLTEQWFGVTPPQWLGPTIAATKDKPVRIVFHNLLPTGVDGDLFLPTDTTLMGSGMGPDMNAPAALDEGTVMDAVRNPLCTDNPQDPSCFKQNRATLHLHGGTSPWISDGTPHQWITPASEGTAWPQGVSVQDVPDMTPANVPNDGIQTFYYTNQQSARLMFYHDHAWGITRLNVYAGEAAGYLIGDDTEKALVNNGTIPGAADTIPLVVQDRTFVPGPAELAAQDPTWDTARWGTKGSFWYHHVYMPAQNPGDPSGMSAYGRWMYGPWFWPPAADTTYGPIANPYYNANCDLNDPSTWTYQTDPFCEPAQIPGTPNISAGMEQFNDTPIVNGVAYPTVTLQPKTYRLRVLNAANDRFFNFQWYVANATTASTGLNKDGQVIGGTEVALDPLLLAQAQTDPVVFPTPVQGAATAGPDWIQIGSEGGFLPAPTVVDGQQPTTWITDPTRFDVGNVDLHSLLLAPAERADVIVDFSKYAGKTLILYNDAPAAFPARVPTYDYYTGAPDQSPNGAAAILPGYGPNTRTIMQVKIAASAPAAAYNLTALRAAFGHKANGSGVFESGQHPIIVGQAAYNSAYGTSFAAGSNCNSIGSTLQICDGLLRINDTATFGFNTLKARTTKSTMPVQPKAIHDEMNSSTFDEFGRMQANIGVTAQPPTPGLLNLTLYPYVNPSTELIDGTNLPKQDVTYDTNGNPVSDIKIAPISDPTDGSQIWRITHNGVDTHPIHFHLYDVQILNRVTWDNIIIATEPSELGWKDTIRVSPLEDTIVALRPIVPEVPWEVPNAIRNLNPMEPTGSTKLFNNIDPQGNPTVAITNQLVNFGWEYVYHCHILSHEEMDMMRPVTLALPPVKADTLANTLQNAGGANRRAVLTWNDNSITETSFVVQRSTDLGATWATAGTITSPLNVTNIHQPRTLTDPSAFDPVTTVRYYRIAARNTVGYGGAFPTMTVESTSTPLVVGPSFTINASAGANGSITPAGDVNGDVVVGRGGSQTFTITPKAGYRVFSLLVDNQPAALTNGTYTFTNVQVNHTIAATFTASAATITATAGANGSVTPPGVQTVAIGGNQTYTITPNPGYHRDTVLVDGVNDPAAVTSGTYTFTNVTANHTISATFTANAFNITTTPGANGTITPANPTVNFGANQTFAIAGNGGYMVADVLVDGVSVGPVASYQFTNVVANHTISATFTPFILSITMTSPTAGTTWPLNSTQSLGYTLSGGAVSVGAFDCFLVDTLTGTYYSAGVGVPVAGRTVYSQSFSTVGIPAGTYSAAVFYRPDATVSRGWTASAWSPYAAVTITTQALSITMTSPTAGTTWPLNSTQSLGYTLSGGAVSVGAFDGFLVDTLTGTYYSAGVGVPVAGRTVYSQSFSTVGIPAGTYSAAVFYRPDATVSRGWTAFAWSPYAAVTMP